MNPMTRRYLQAAKSQLGAAVHKIASRSTVGRSLTPNEKDQVLGLGTARDWIRWSAALKGIQFDTKSENGSGRRQGIVESLRFTQIWTGTNALFSRDSVLRVLGPPPRRDSEIDRFRIIYAGAGITASPEESSILQTLNGLLDMECNTRDVAPMLTIPSSSPRNPNLAAQPYPTMWEVIYKKYLRPTDQARGIGKVIGHALASRRYPRPDGPTLIYGARNWTVHGMLLTSFFRGSEHKYRTFVDNINLLLASVLAGASRELAARV